MLSGDIDLRMRTVRVDRFANERTALRVQNAAVRAQPGPANTGDCLDENNTINSKSGADSFGWECSQISDSSWPKERADAWLHVHSSTGPKVFVSRAPMDVPPEPEEATRWTAGRERPAPSPYLSYFIWNNFLLLAGAQKDALKLPAASLNERKRTDQ